MTPEEKSRAIQEICEWMGWHRETHTEEEYRVELWVDSTGEVRDVVDSFDPFESPDDCKVVMDEVVTLKAEYVSYGCSWSTVLAKHHAYITVDDRSHSAKGATEEGAKMHALLAMIRSRRTDGTTD